MLEEDEVRPPINGVSLGHGLGRATLQLVLPQQVGRLTNLFAARKQSISWSQIDVAVAWLLGRR